MQQTTVKEHEGSVNNRRGSLAISALLNEDTRQSPGLDDSPVLSSGTASPISMSESQLSKAKRKRISPTQYNRLMEIFEQTDTPSSEIRENLAQELHMTKREVQVWFQNRRAKMNRIKNQRNNRHRHSLIPHSSVLSNNYHHLQQAYHHQQQAKPTRRASAYSFTENTRQQPPAPARFYPQHQVQFFQPGNQYPTAPMPSLLRQGYRPFQKDTYEEHQVPLHPPPPSVQHHHQRSHSHRLVQEQRKPSAIDLLASAAEYVRTDRKQIS